MISNSSSQLERRISSLENHLKVENPVLLQIVQSFRELDRVAYRMGILDHNESFAIRVPWWPLISVLGTYSAGKSSFINSFLQQNLQRSGNQAVDDKFTVICFSKEEKSRTLPGLALDADPRFPFYQIGEEIEKVSVGEGQRIDAYLQLKTCLTEKLRGKILIDSPGFDADAQRNATLRITDYIMDLSDLILVFFDARHPEPGAMKDTLDHLVKNTINRSDSNKFLFILNQIDCTATDDNLEDVVAAWQRALSQSGLTAGRFYQIYNLDVASTMPNEAVRQRYEAKRQQDMREIEDRIQRVEVERAYRVIGVLESTAKMIGGVLVPSLSRWLGIWRRRVIALDFLVLALFGLGFMQLAATGPYPVKIWLDMGLWFTGEWWQSLLVDLAVAVVLVVMLAVNHFFRNLATNSIIKRINTETEQADVREYLENSFRWNTRPMRFVFQSRPSGWSNATHRKLQKVLKDIDGYVQNLNDQFTNPSGKHDSPNPVIHLDVG